MPSPSQVVGTQDLSKVSQRGVDCAENPWMELAHPEEGNLDIGAKGGGDPWIPRRQLQDCSYHLLTTCWTLHSTLAHTLTPHL